MLPRHQAVAVLALSTSWWLFLDLSAVWGASLITIFGQAATTPPELMGLFALGCVLASFAVLAATRRRSWPVLALVLALLARGVLTAGPGGQVQLWAASVGVAAVLAWMAHLVTRLGSAIAPGIATGWVLQTSVAAATGTWLPVWSGGIAGFLVLGIMITLSVSTAVFLFRPAREALEPPSRRIAWSVLPVTLVAGVAIVNPGRASVLDPQWGPLALVLGCVLAMAVSGVPQTAGPGRRLRVLAGAVAVGCVAISLLVTTTAGGVEGVLSQWSFLALLVGPASLAWILRPDVTAEVAAVPADVGFSVLGGAVVWTLLFFAYYAGYDLGYRADVVLVVATAAIAGWAIRCTAGSFLATSRRLTALVAPVALLVAAVGVATHRAPVREVTGAPGEPLEVVAYNLRMGYGSDGRFDAAEVARTLAGADVALLSEIDRGWLLNGGQDQLAILARLTGKRLVFNPAADPVWGDAILTDLPVEEVRGTSLESYEAVTGAGVLSVRVRVGDLSAWFVSTHVQPTSAREDGTIDQTADVAAIVSELAADGTPVVLGGDFNFAPKSASFQAVTEAGLADALGGVRPLPTSDSVDPRDEIDHVFHRTPWTVVQAGTEASQASDHLPVRVLFDTGGWGS